MNDAALDKVTLVFDGDCGFCTTSANWIVDRSKVAIQAVPFQWANLDEFGLTQAAAASKVQLVTGGRIYAGHKCVAKILRLQPNPLLRALGFLALVPIVSQIGAGFYWLIAKNRHKLPGGTPACKLPKKD